MVNRIMRLLLDVVVFIVSIVATVYFTIGWSQRGFPLYGKDDMFGAGGKDTILPWLGVGLIFFVIALIAALDFYVYRRRDEK